MALRDSSELGLGESGMFVPDGFVAKPPAATTHDEALRYLTPGNSLSGKIDFAGDTDRIRLDLQPGTYVLSLTGAGADPLLDPYLRSRSSGIAGDDDGGTAHNALVTFTVGSAGVYTFDLEAYPDSDLTGGYVVHLEQMGTDSVPDDTSSTVDANIDAPTLGFFETASDVDFYRVHLEEGVYYNFTLAAGVDYDTESTGPGEVDTYVSVVSRSGAQFMGASAGESGDASGGFVAPTTGDYYVQVRSQSGQPSTGYELRIDATDISQASPLDAIDWGGTSNVAEAGPLNDGVLYVYFAAADEAYDGYTSLGWTAYETQRAMAAFETYSRYANLSFATTTTQSQATFTLVTVDSDEFLGTFNPPGTPGAGIGAFSITGFGWDRDGSTGGLAQGGYGFSTLVHEFGHALGLAHPHDGGGGSDVMLGVSEEFDSYGLFGLNQAVYTVMSYNDAWPLHPDRVNGSPADDVVDRGFVGTPMALDVAVIQQKYGATAFNAGNTVYTLANGNVPGTLYQTIWDTGGSDTIRYNGSADATIDLTAATLDYSSTGGGVVSYVANVFGGLTIANGVTIENARGGLGNDRLTGNAAANQLVGSAGHDMLVGLGGNDILSGDDGYDRMDGGDGNDRLAGGNGADQLDGGTGDDRLSGDAEDDELDGGAGTDLMLGGTGNDHLAGEDGNDAMYGGADNDELQGDAGNDRLYGEAGNDKIYGGQGADTLVGDAGDDILYGEGGVDLMKGGLGNDTYQVDNPADRIVELDGEGSDTVIAALNYTLPDAIENGMLTATAAMLTGNAQANALAGNNSNNTLDGLAGADTMRGGFGDDIYYVDDPNDLVFEIENAGSDTVYSTVSYTLRESPPPPPGYDPYAGAGIQPWYTGENQIETLVLLGSANLSATGNTSANSIYGNSGDNRLDGGAANDKLYGADGVDRAFGGANNDYLAGEAGDDWLYGDDGTDRLNGGAGKDRLTGGLGSDIFEFHNGDTAATYASADIIADFSHAEGDRIQLAPMDANALAAGNQAFTFIGTGAFGGTAGELHYLQTGATTYVEGETNGDGVADFIIRLTGLHDLLAGDFAL